MFKNKNAFTLIIRSTFLFFTTKYIDVYILICIYLNSSRFRFFFFVFFSSSLSLVCACFHTNRDATKLMPENLDPSLANSQAACAVCPWDEEIGENATVSVSVCPWDDDEPPSTSKQAIAR